MDESVDIFEQTVEEIYSPRPSIRIPVIGGEATCAKLSVDDVWLAIGTSKGGVEVYESDRKRLAFSLQRKTGDYGKWACTTLDFRPSSNVDLTSNVLFSCDVAGHIHRWHATTGKHLSTIKEANQIYTIDFQPSGLQYATAGQDCKGRVYDGTTWQFLHLLQEGDGETTVGHTNRIFAVKWHPIDSQVLLSGGWDNTIQIWDVRVEKSVRSIFGPRLSGQALDIKSSTNEILTGSWRSSEQLQEWDYGSGKLIRNLDLESQSLENLEPCRLYAARYGKDVSQDLIVAGGSGSNELFIIDSRNGKLIGRTSPAIRAIHSLSLSSDGSRLVVTIADCIEIYNLKTLIFPT